MPTFSSQDSDSYFVDSRLVTLLAPGHCFEAADFSFPRGSSKGQREEPFDPGILPKACLSKSAGRLPKASANYILRTLQQPFWQGSKIPSFAGPRNGETSVSQPPRFAAWKKPNRRLLKQMFPSRHLQIEACRNAVSQMFVQAIQSGTYSTSCLLLMG